MNDLNLIDPPKGTYDDGPPCRWCKQPESEHDHLWDSDEDEHTYCQPAQTRTVRIGSARFVELCEYEEQEPPERDPDEDR